jgi:hypothetical protein
MRDRLSRDALRLPIVKQAFDEEPNDLAPPLSDTLLPELVLPAPISVRTGKVLLRCA